MRQAQDGPIPEGSTREGPARNDLDGSVDDRGGARHGFFCRLTRCAQVAPSIALALVSAGCGGTLDAGWNNLRDGSPVGNPDTGAGGAPGGGGNASRDAGGGGTASSGGSALRDGGVGGTQGSGGTQGGGGTQGSGGNAARDAEAYDVNDAGAADSQDADGDAPHGLLPVDERNPVIIDNDGWSDNWQGEFAVLLANNGGPTLAGIVVGATSYWDDVEKNREGWSQFVTAARASGLKNVPDVTEGASKTLTQPDDGAIDSTSPVGSAGARLIVRLSRQLSQPSRPVVILTGAALTNVADAYLLDHGVVDRVVVVASLGRYKAPKGITSGPNGDLDPWADWIVTQRFRFVQIGIDYDQANDVTTDNLSSLPNNAFGQWMANKQADLSNLKTAADQVTVLAAGVPSFVRAVQRSSPDTSGGFNSPPGQGPPLVPDAAGKSWVVTEFAPPPFGPSFLWQMLLNPHTFGS